MSFAVPVMAQLEAAGPGTVAGLWVARVLTYLSLSLVVGLLLAAGWLLRDHHPGGRLGPAGERAMRGAALCAGVWTAACVGLFLLGLANATARPVSEILDPTTLGRFLATRYGAGVAVQAAVAAGVCLLATAARDRVFARVALVGAAAGAAALASSGHAGTAAVPALAMVNDTLHILAAASWVGGLLVVVVLVLGRHGPDDVSGPAQRFSRLAGWALTAVLLTGVVNSVMHLDEAAQLVDTSWGRLALVKVALSVGIALLGWLNRHRLLPRVTAGAGVRRGFRKAAVAELALMLLAFGTATAMASGLPADVEAAARLQVVRTPFADGQIEVTLAPATTGVNELHLYFFDADSAPREVEDAAVTLAGPTATVDVRLLAAGPGHYTAPAVQLTEAGTYEVEVTALVDGSVQRATASFTVS